MFNSNYSATSGNRFDGWVNDPSAEPSEQRAEAVRRLGWNSPHLNLAGLQLRTLPSAMGQLSHLQSINLTGNPLRAIPESVSNLATRGCTVIGADISRLPISQPPSRRAPTQVPPRQASSSARPASPPLGNPTPAPRSPQQVLNDWVGQGGHWLPEYARPAHAAREDAARRIGWNSPYLNLAGLQLDTLPPSIGQFSHLRSINLSGVRLRSLPDSIFSLSPECRIFGLDASLLPQSEIARIQAATTGPRIEFNMGSTDGASASVSAAGPARAGYAHPAPAPATSRGGRSQPVPMASTSARRENNPLTQAVTQWATAAGRHNQPAQWSQFNREPNASSFTNLLQRLGETAEARNASTRPSIANRVGDVLDALGSSPELRATCFAVAEDALATCGDRVALGFEYIEDAIVNHQAERGDLPEDALLKLGKQKFRQSVVENIAREKTASLRAVDPVEVHLAYRVKLKDRLDLPGKSNDMLYFGVAGVSDHDLNQASAIVQSLESGQQMQDFICDYEPWKSHLKRTHAPVFEANLAPVMAEMERFSVPPPSMNSAQYMSKCDELVRHRETVEKETVRSLTKPHFPVAYVANAAAAPAKRKNPLRRFFRT